MSSAPGAPNAAPALANEARDLTVIALATISCALPAFLVGTLAVEMRRSLHFGATALGLTVTLYYLGAASFAVPFGKLVDRVGSIRVMRVAVPACAALLVLVAMAAWSWWALATLMVPCGMVAVAVETSASQFLARRLSVGHQGFAFGVKQAAVPFASLLGGIAVPVIALTIGWRWAFAFAAVLAATTALLVPAPLTSLAARTHQRRSGPVPQVRLPPLVLLSVGLGLGVTAASGFTAFLVTAGVANGLSQGDVGLVAALASAAAAVIRVVIGRRADRRGSGHFPVVAVMLAAGTAGYVLLAIGSATGSSVFFVVGAMVALGIGWGWNGLFSFAVVNAHMQAPARASGVTQVGGRLGGVVGPAVVGVVAASMSYSAAWLLSSAVSLVGAIAIVASNRMLRAASTAAPAPLGFRPDR